MVSALKLKLAPLRGDTRFATIVRKLQLPE